MAPVVLVVDDSAAARDAIVRVLRDEGFAAVPAADGAEALAYLSEGNIVDVILLDVVMPVMDGWTFRRAQLRDPWLADIPVIVLTALAGSAVTALRAAAALRKPVGLQQLIATVRAVSRC